MLPSAIAALPPPECPEDLGTACPGPFQAIDPATGKPLGNLIEPCERVASESRPGELDVCVRCKHCQARAHYTLDSASGRVLDADALAARREKVQSPKSKVQSQPLTAPEIPGLSVSPDPEPQEHE